MADIDGEASVVESAHCTFPTWVTAAELLAAHRHGTGAAPALISTVGSALSYRDLASAVDAVSDDLRALGIESTDRVAMVLPDGIDAALILLSLLTACSCVVLNPSASADELTRVFHDVRPAAVVVAPGLSQAARGVAASHGCAVLELGDPADGHRLVRWSGQPVHTPLTQVRPGTLVLRTSGTTAHGKLVALPWDTALAGAQASVRAYGLSAADRRLNIMPMFHVQGTVGSVLAALVPGGSVVCADGFVPEEVPRLLHAHGITWFSASPTMHERILDAMPVGWRVPACLRFVRCGSAGLPLGLRARLERAYEVPVVESYGMTEAHQIASTPLRADATAMVPTGAVVRVRTTAGDIVATPGVRGEIVVRGPNVISGYLAPVEADAEAFVDGWFRTGDEGMLLDDGCLRLTGRIKDLIIRGGEKISPSEVEDVLMRHPAVKHAAVFGVADGPSIEKVAAAVVLRDGESADSAQLRQFARQRLAPVKVPVTYLFLDRLPTTDTGKVSRTQLAERVAAAGAQPCTAGERASPVDGDHAGRAPRTHIERQLAALWAAALKVPAVSLDDDFFAMGGESVEAAVLIGMVREVMGVEVSALSMFDEASTLAGMAALVERLRDGSRAGSGDDGISLHENVREASVEI